MLKPLLGFLISLSTSSYAASGAGVTYHGRLVDPNGNPVSTSNVQFRLQVKTPGNESCLLYEEIQAKDMSLSNGVFSLTLNDGNGARQDASTYSIDQIFANRSTFTFPAGYCASGTTYFPNSADGRQLQVYFNDGSFAGWEPVPSQGINFVPMAIEAMQVGGYKKESLVKVATGVDTTGFDLSAANFTELVALLTGTSTQFVKPSAATFTAAPQWSGTPTAGSDLANKTYVDAQVAAGLPNFGTAGTYTKVTTDAKGRVSSGTTLSATDIPALDAAKITTGVLPIANGGTNSSTALAGSKVMVSSASAIVEGMASNTAKSNNTFVMRDGSGNIAGALGTFDGLSVLLGGTLNLNGATSGTLSLAAPTAVTNYTMTLPATAGGLGQVLTTDGTGILSWTTSSGLPASAGTAAAPGYAFSGNTNTGMFNPAANQIGFSTNGAEALRIDAVGRVGIGTNNPTGGTLHVYNGNNGGVAGYGLVYYGNGYGFYGQNTGSYGAWTGAGVLGKGVSAVRGDVDYGGIGNTGAALIGQTTALVADGQLLRLQHKTSAFSGTAFLSDMASGSGSFTGNFAEFKNNSVTQFVVKSDGSVGIGTATPGSALDVKGSLRLSGATSGYVGFAPAAAAGSTTYTLPSADGGTGQFLQTNGTGTLAWATPAGGVSGSGTVGAIPKFSASSTLADSAISESTTVNFSKGLVVGGSRTIAADPGNNLLLSSGGATAILAVRNSGGIQASTAQFEVLGSNATALRLNSGNTFSWDLFANFATDQNIHLVKNNGTGTSLVLDNSALDMVGIAAPAAPAATSGRIYYDSTAAKFKVSENGGAFTNLVSSGGTPAGATTQLQFNDAGAFGASANLNWDKTNSRLGIGTSTPQTPLEIFTGDALTSPNNLLKVKNSSCSAGTGAGIALSVECTGGAGTYIGSKIVHVRSGGNSIGDMAFFTNSTGGAGDATTEKMRILSTGNVGIGTTAPGQKLSVAGTIESTSGGIKFPDGTTQTTAAPQSIGFSANGSSQSVPNATSTTVVNGTELWDKAANYDPVTGIFTAPAAGIYSCNCQIDFETFNAGSRVAVGISGTGIVGNASLGTRNICVSAPCAFSTSQHISATAVGSTIKCVAYQESGSSYSLSGDYRTNFSCHYLGQ